MDEPGQGWRVVTWNVLGSHDPDLAAVAAELRSREPDVVALQEVRRSQARRLAALLGWRHTWKRKHYPYSPLVWWRAEGMAVLTPWALREPRKYVLSVGEPIWIYRHRIMVAATVVRDGRALRVYDVHLSTGPDDRIDQARRAAGFIDRDRPGALVVCGDLNVHGDEAIEALREFRRVGVRDTGGELTNPAEAPVQRIDYVLVPEGAEVRAVHTPDGGEDWRRLSDHLPVLVEFTPPG